MAFLVQKTTQDLPTWSFSDHEKPHEVREPQGEPGNPLTVKIKQEISRLLAYKVMFSGCSRKVPCTSHLPLSTTTSVNFSNCRLPQPLPVLRCSSSSLPTNPRPPRHQKRLSAALARGLRRPDEVNLMALKKRFLVYLRNQGRWNLVLGVLLVKINYQDTRFLIPYPQKTFTFPPTFIPPRHAYAAPKNLFSYSSEVSGFLAPSESRSRATGTTFTILLKEEIRKIRPALIR